ncbi:c-type cytochrome [Sphingobacterium humi]|uniref:C-type cytochrome n=1 Tax=Sphingobacterium humi TaxID=1796905 RepID=A0A6N8L697_9SPHI|nr:cytochrome c [Sphingobacterium humi]MVZ63981.1 c-type cytochrome [Sphingobacterium humi]
MLIRSTLYISSIIGALYLLFSCQSDLSIKTMQYATNGQKLYVTHCQNCHGAQGEGLGQLYPPLTDDQFFTQHREQLACIVKNGMAGEITVNGKTYNQQMPGVPQMSAIDIAYVLTYVTTTFGKSKTHFSQEEIEAFLAKCK